MEMEKDKDQLFKILSGSKEKASENLKYRIMHQIQTERALSQCQKEKKRSNTFWSTVIPVLAIMYALIGLILGGFYYLSEKEAVNEKYVSMVLMLVICISSVYLFISVFDEKRKNKQINKKK